MLALVPMERADASGSAKPKHRLLFELGRGGMGTVYLAVSDGPSGFRKLKVVKRLRADLAAERDFLKMFLDEARLCARLAHPNVVQTNEVGFDGTHYFLEMEYLEGQTLEAILRAGDSSPNLLPVPVVLWMIAQALAGLHYAHELTDLSASPLGVVHRDVSPHNVFVTYDGHVKVLDFGIAKAVDSTVDTRTGGVKGKVSYLSPEQALRRPLDRRVDVFATGVILWRALTGERLWSGLSEGEIFSRLAQGAPPSPRTVVAEVSPVLDAICTRALAHDPDDRYATAEEMQRALEDAIDGLGPRISSRQVATAVRSLFGARRDDHRRLIEARLKRVQTEDIDEDRLELDVPPLVAPTRDSDPGTIDPAPHTASATAVARVISDRPEGEALPPAREATGTPFEPRMGIRARSIAIGIVAVALAGISISFFAKKRSAPGAPSNASITASVDSPPVAHCRSQRECAGNGSATSCRMGKCVSLASEDCRVLAEPNDLRDDSTIWFGAMLPLSGDDGSMYGQANANALDLARRDFVTMHGGLPSPTIGASVRPLGIVLCDDSVDATRAAKHLVDDVGVPAIVGFHTSRELTDLASTLFIPKGVLAIAALNTSPLITHLPHPPGSPRLVWRTTFNSADCAVPIASLVSTVYEPELRTGGLLSTSEKLRVAVVRTSNSAALSAVDALASALRFNGRTVLENGDDFRQFDTDAPTTVSDLASYHPHVIIYLDAESFTENIVSALEDAWPKHLRYRPRYASFGTAGLSTLDRFIGSNADRRHRFLAVELPASTTANLDFANRYNLAYQPSVTPATAPGVAYDAFYVLALSAYVTSGSPLTGTSLARGIARLSPPGTPIDVRPTRIDSALDALRSGGNADLSGAATTLDFDLATGDVRSDFAVYCLRAGENGKPIEVVESGLVFRGTAERFEGALACP